MLLEEHLTKQLEDVIQEWSDAASRARHEDASDMLSPSDVRDLETRCVAAIERVAGFSSVYSKRAQAVLDSENHMWGHLRELIGVARSLLSDIRNGYLRSMAEIIHSDVFSDYLEMAEHLCTTGYKDAAAVIVGSTLEAHLRNLSGKFNIEVVNDNGYPKKVDALNAELVKAGAYSKLDQKSITAWLGLRNDAAHGHYERYSHDQVCLLIDNVRSFISRVPA